MSVPIEAKRQIIKKWQHSNQFTEREIEYLALEVVKFQGYKNVGIQELTTLAVQELDQIWNDLKGYTDTEKVVLMTRLSDHPEVKAILKSYP